MFMKVKFDLYLHVGYVSKESVASGNWHPWRQGAPEGKMSMERNQKVTKLTLPLPGRHHRSGEE